jgi:hypothetical protein
VLLGWNALSQYSCAPQDREHLTKTWFMRQRGRKSSASHLLLPLHVVAPSLPLELPPAPDHLSEGMKAWWRQIVADYALDPHHLKLVEAAADETCLLGRYRPSVSSKLAYRIIAPNLLRN